jgi:hypothetical protein
LALRAFFAVFLAALLAAFFVDFFAVLLAVFLAVFLAAFFDFLAADCFAVFAADFFAVFFFAAFLAVFLAVALLAFPAARLGAARFRFGGVATAIGGTIGGSETIPSPANGKATGGSSAFSGGCSALSAWLAASVANVAMSFTVSVIRSSSDLSLSMKPSRRLVPQA